jgi:hypothetical protein
MALMIELSSGSRFHMRLALCSLCERHVQPEARECPFCGTRLGVAIWQPTVVLATMLGMALVGCGDKSSEGASGSASMSAGTSGMATDAKAESTGVDDVPDGGGYDYDGAPPDWTTTTSTSTTGEPESTGSTGGSESSTGTDTDTDTDTDDGTTGSGG